MSSVGAPEGAKQEIAAAAAPTSWRKCLLGWRHSITPTFTRYTNFRPETLIGWHRRFVKRWWWMITLSGKRRSVGRPRIDASVEKIIIDIKADNPGYGSKRISLMVTEQLGVTLLNYPSSYTLAACRIASVAHWFRL